MTDSALSDRYRPAVHKKRDGLLLIRQDASVRFLTFWEGVKWRMFGEFPGS